MILPLVAAICLGSCKGDEGPMGPAGPAGHDGQNGQDGKDGDPCTNFLRYDFTVDSDYWELVKNEDNGKAYYKYSFKFEELTKDICNYGIVGAYLMWDEDKVTYQSQLPTVRHNKEGDDYFTCTIDYDFGPQDITFYVTNSDFYVEDKPETMVFRVAIYYPTNPE